MSIPTSADPRSAANTREGALFALAFLFVTLAAGALFLAPAARAGSWSQLGGRWGHLLVPPVWLGCVVLVRRVAVKRAPARDPFLLPIGYLLAGWGALLIWRLLPQFGLRQTGWLVVGSLVLVVILRGPANLQWLRRYRHLWLAGGLFLTGLTLFFGTNPSGGEPRLWLGCCGFYFQPSEPLRLLLVAFLAAYISERAVLQWDQEQPMLLSILGPLVVVWGLSTLLLFVQRDLGTGSLFIGLLAIMLYVATRRRLILALAGLFVLLGGAFGVLAFQVVADRVRAWLNPWVDPLGTGYQLIQSLLALADGGVFGQGFGIGAPGVVPATHTDFIFTAVAEEWGLLGALAVIGALAVLVARGLRGASSARDPFHALLATGLAVGIGLQSFLIIGGVIRVVPLTGVTLPFVSYGGSSLVTSFAALGFLLLASNARSGGNRFGPGIQRVHLGLLAAWVVLAAAAGWWGVLRGPNLLARADNPRRAIETRYVPRGDLLDRQERPLARTVGARGDYERRYPEPAAGPVIGFNSARYGQSGLEASLDRLLRGEEGYDAWSELRAKLLTGHPPAGLDVRLTLDAELQRAAAGALAGQSGAALVLDAESGEILGLASTPSFDPARIDETWDQLRTDEGAPLLNRATQSLYQPGLALAPLLYAWTWEVDPSRAQRVVADIGRPLRVDGQVLRCAAAVGSSIEAPLARAVGLACPGPLADLAVDLGPEGLRSMAAAFGLDQAPQLRLDVSGPDRVDFPAAEADLRLEGVGQGALNLSPLQLARAFSALAADGELPALQLADAQRAPADRWRSLPALGARRDALSAASAHEALAALQTAPDGQPEFVATAVSGASGGGLAWYFGLVNRGSQRLVVVVVLEGASASQVRLTGRAVLDAAAP